MAKLHFYYAVMNSGKSIDLIRTRHNYMSLGFNTGAITHSADNRFGLNKIASRIGLECDAIGMDKITVDDLLKLFPKFKTEPGKSILFVDEVQFFDPKSIFELSNLVDYHNIPVITYGLKIDSNGNIWDGSRELIALANDIKEIKNICKCGSKATHILRYDANHDIIRGGEQLCVGDASTNPEKQNTYESVCRKCWKDVYHPRGR